jgi:hypothetical protein
MKRRTEASSLKTRSIVGVSSPGRSTPATRTSLEASKAMWTTSSRCCKLDMGRLLPRCMWIDPRILLHEGAGPLLWRAPPWVTTTGSLFVVLRTAASFSSFVLEGPRRCRPPLRAESAGAVEEVSSPEEREAEPGERGELCEPTALPALTVAAPRSVGLTPVPDPRRPRLSSLTWPLTFTFARMEQPLFSSGVSPRTQRLSRIFMQRDEWS